MTSVTRKVLQRLTFLSAGAAGMAGLVGSLSGCAHKPAPVAVPPVATSAGSTRAPAPRPAAPEAETAGSADVPLAKDGDAIFFDFDVYVLREDARPELQKLAGQLKQNPRLKVRIEGNTDERGTTEYNLALGEQRARAAKDYLSRLGIDGSRIQITTFGSERPKAVGHDEDAWAKNRRDDLVIEHK